MKMARLVHILFILILVIFVTFCVVKISGYMYASYLCSEIRSGNRIETNYSNGTTAPVFYNDVARILQTEGPKIPLVEACYYRNVQAVSVLLQNGADPNLFFEGRKSPIEAALWNGPAGPIDKNSLEIVEMLIDAGADVHLHASDESIIDSLSILMIPGEKYREEIFLFLLDHGAIKTPIESSNILHNVIRCGNVPLAKKLIAEYGFSANSIGHNGQTPLILAVYYSPYNSGASATLEMIKMLLDCGADKDFTDDFGKNALDYAMEYGLDSIVDLLE